MTSVFVYRLDPKTRERIPLGILMERRKAERGDNEIGMLRMARKEFAGTEAESRTIFIHYD